MVFIGDIAIPYGINGSATNTAKYFNDMVIANLEGAIVPYEKISLNERKLFNAVDVLPYLKELKVKAVSLANNHIFDARDYLKFTLLQLQENNIMAFGAGDSIKEAEKPCLLKQNGKTILLLGFGWKVINCQVAGKKKPGVNPLEPKHLLSSVEAARKQFPNANIILFMHWNYELELYPQPMHRQLAFRAIDMGANAVVGCHSHCVQGIEVYREAPIIYGLGNWLIPYGKFFNGKINFSTFCKRELAFEWEPDLHRMVCHWFECDQKQHELNYIKSEDLKDSSWISELTPFGGMTHIEYINWFRQNRKKKTFLPVYEDYRHSITNWLRDCWVLLRGSLTRSSFLRHA